MSAISIHGLFSSYSSISLKKSNSEPTSLTDASSLFDSTVSKHKTSVCKVLKKIAAEVINERTTSIINSVLGEARAVYGLVKTFFKNMIKVARIFAATELSKAFSIPFDIHNLILGAYDFIVQKGEGRVDAFLGILGSLSEIGDAVSSFAAMLVEIGALGASTMAWATPLNLASCALSAVFIVMNARSLYFSIQVERRLNQHLKKPSTPNYRGAYDVLKKHKYALGRHCSVDVQLIQTKIRQIYKARRSASTKDKKILDARLETVFKKMKRRIHQKQFSLALGILMTKLGILATATFAFSPFFAPLAIVGFSSLAILFATSLFKMGFDFYANARLKHSIKAIPAA